MHSHPRKIKNSRISQQQHSMYAQLASKEKKGSNNIAVPFFLKHAGKMCFIELELKQFTNMLTTTAVLRSNMLMNNPNHSLIQHDLRYTRLFCPGSYLHMHINSQCFLEELLLLAVPRIAVKEHPQVAQPETQMKGMSIISTITVSIDRNVVKLAHLVQRT